MEPNETETLAAISDRGQMILPARVRKALGIGTQGQVAVRLVKRGDHFIAEIEEASVAARARNETSGALGKKLVERMTKKYGNSPKIDAMADERGES